jgi:Ni/Co efflux regulator RcnB
MKYALTAALAIAMLGNTSAMAQQHNAQKDSHAGGQTQGNIAQWSKGGQVPDQYKKSQYTVTDWKNRNLQAPDKGSHWVRNDNNQYALATHQGVISDVVSQDAYPDTHAWSRGERVPSQYRSGDYVVSDWQSHHLKRPSRGHHWVHVNNQYLLVAIATGLIGSLVADGR